MNSCFIYVLNAPNGTCHKFDYWGEFELGSVENFLEGKGFRLKDIEWLTSDEEVIHDASLPGEVIHDTQYSFQEMPVDLYVGYLPVAYANSGKL